VVSSESGMWDCGCSSPESADLVTLAVMTIL